MKATGIVRRIDELGRIVLPKETRRILGIPEGTPMEIFVEKDQVVLKKYIPEANLLDAVNALETQVECEAVNIDPVKSGAIITHIKAIRKALKE